MSGSGDIDLGNTGPIFQLVAGSSSHFQGHCGADLACPGCRREGDLDYLDYDLNGRPYAETLFHNVGSCWVGGSVPRFRHGNPLPCRRAT